MRVLGIDAASGACSAALIDADGALCRRFEAMERGQAEALAPMIDAVLGEAGVAAADLDAIGVTVGPGAFTGVRIGLAAARGLGLASSTPVIGVTTFAAIAESLSEKDRRGCGLLICVESRRDDFFVQLLDEGGAALAEPAALFDGDIEPYIVAAAGDRALLVAGDGASRLAAAVDFHGIETSLAPGNGLPDAVYVAGLARRRALVNGAPDINATAPAPLYLRPPDVTPPSSS